MELHFCNFWQGFNFFYKENIDQFIYKIINWTVHSIKLLKPLFILVHPNIQLIEQVDIRF